MNAAARRWVLFVGVLAVGIVAHAGSVQALTITPAGTSFTGNLSTGTSWSFTDSFTGLTVKCTTHTVKGKTVSPAAALVSIAAGATNIISTMGTSCSYSGFGTGSGTVTTTASWTWTFFSLAGGVAGGSLTIPASAATIKLTGSLNCTITVNASTLAYTYTNATKVLATNGANSVSTSGCLTTPTPTLQESVVVTGGITVT